MEWTLDLTQLQDLGRVALAMILGSIIGFERERAHKPAGLRTHMFVAGGAALLVSLGDGLVVRSSVPPAQIQADPVRMVEAIIMGISFLGAGTILLRPDEERVEGLTTAASLLFVTSIGISVALDQWVLAGGATVLALIVLQVLKRLFEK